jgi:rhodanese-related sulfurtransferase
MRFTQFLRLDLAGAALYIVAWFGVGFAFSGALEVVTRGYRTFGQWVSWVVAGLVVGYVLLVLWRWIRQRALKAVSFAIPAEVADAVRSGANIYDVRSHGYLDRNAIRISGSKRLDPHSLHQPNEPLPIGQPIFVYCTCVREATSARVARELEKSGIRVRVIKGGLRAWKRAGLPVEPVPLAEMAVLPAFERV